MNKPTSEIRGRVAVIKFARTTHLGDDTGELLNPVIDECSGTNLRHFVLDVADVGHLNPHGFAIILGALLRAQGVGGNLVLCNANDRIKQFLESAQAPRKLFNYESVEVAVGALS
ncbi:MAG: hypothetical protein A2898_01735 [Candidatus Kerfeldbacteria bacterium RIFCSPLOWO2_01_FULL_48_11]|uniref:STAS domain-containing protein n=1 Tax=Candidatus Kerfeldbacteria bacterium RIFCSPLOWO2_01_FULL_48_11 TaxID=1798543 RepID=A0A1G2B5I9_9BACT|nr:MAG: hypothetical protein UY34_C0010G0092 [Parcubacteria group bacterium GW2011_GWA2_48_9]KKW16554.1 MAG: hypothetical protein UY52_C0003G0050 [Parcubacteria group bacterium GW2011_GWC2_49_9]OGY83976.1 MAG: hypothetical protein A2898_01735 [Candidatus Kerfeldbacteria bacterium RIFCSPLOWO2_01_FULL_48_11]HCM68318.1 hypothetical protein [Candidatus Kerfeldbacteria bacterium]